MDSVRVSSRFWLEQLRSRGKDFRIELRTNIVG